MNITDQQANMLARVLRSEYRPHRLMKSMAGLTYETISYPWFEHGQILVNVRVPGDPTSMITVDVFDMSAEGRDCLCSNDVRSQFYFVDSPADAERRTVDIEHLTSHVRKEGGQ